MEKGHRKATEHTRTRTEHLKLCKNFTDVHTKKDVYSARQNVINSILKSLKLVIGSSF